MHRFNPVRRPKFLLIAGVIFLAQLLATGVFLYLTDWNAPFSDPFFLVAMAEVVTTPVICGVVALQAFK